MIDDLTVVEWRMLAKAARAHASELSALSGSPMGFDSATRAKYQDQSIELQALAVKIEKLHLKNVVS